MPASAHSPRVELDPTQHTGALEGDVLTAAANYIRNSMQATVHLASART